MKRCPEESGGCGELTEFLFDSGLCSKCDAKAKSEPKRPGRKPKPKPPDDGMCRRACGRPRHMGRCKKSPVAETEPAPRKKRAASVVRYDDVMMLMQLRKKYQAEHDEAVKRVLVLEAKIDVLDDIEKAMPK